MSYLTIKNLIDDIRIKTASHPMVEMVHFGENSDITFPKDGIEVKYPYVFFILEPVSVTRQMRKVKLTMIIMTQCLDLEESILNTQSDMMDIGCDLISRYTLVNSEVLYSTEDKEWFFTPFVDAHSDRVAGVTTEITFSIPQPLTNCQNPIVVL